MTFCIGIQNDFIRHKNGEEQSFSARWRELARARGIATKTVDVDSDQLYSDLAGCDGFMWRFGYDPVSLHLAKRILPSIEQGIGIPVFPSWSSYWHFEDKIAQHYLMQAARIPSPRTWIFWNKDLAKSFCHSATYPLVAKLSSGIQSNNVRLLRNAAEADDLIDQLFTGGLVSLQPPASLARKLIRHRLQGMRLVAGKKLPLDIQHGYLYVQEFIPDNEFDTRVTVIGNRAFAFRRFNRPGDFRASGSGRIDWDPLHIDEKTVELAFDVAQKLNTQSIAIDGLRRGEDRVVGELSYTYASWAIRDCPGHWERSRASSVMKWVEGQTQAEDAIFEDFVRTLDASKRPTELPASPSVPVSMNRSVR